MMTPLNWLEMSVADVGSNTIFSKYKYVTVKSGFFLFLL